MDTIRMDEALHWDTPTQLAPAVDLVHPVSFAESRPNNCKRFSVTCQGLVFPIVGGSALPLTRQPPGGEGGAELRAQLPGPRQRGHLRQGRRVPLRRRLRGLRRVGVGGGGRQVVGVGRGWVEQTQNPQRFSHLGSVPLQGSSLSPSSLLLANHPPLFFPGPPKPKPPVIGDKVHFGNPWMSAET